MIGCCRKKARVSLEAGQKSAAGSASVSSGPAYDSGEFSVDPSLIFSFGNSLTRGHTGRFGVSHPYSLHLAELVDQRRLELLADHGRKSGVDLSKKFEFFESGVDGQCCDKMLIRLRTVLQEIVDSKKCLPSICIILGGTNDLGYSRPIKSINKDLQSMYDICHKCNIRVVAVEVPTNTFDLDKGDFSSGYNTKKSKINDFIRGFAEKNDDVISVEVVSWIKITDREERQRLWGDHLHYSPAGYDLMAEQLFAVMKDWLFPVGEVDSSPVVEEAPSIDPQEADDEGDAEESEGEEVA